MEVKELIEALEENVARDASLSSMEGICPSLTELMILSRDLYLISSRVKEIAHRQKNGRLNDG